MNFQFDFPSGGKIFNENWWLPTSKEWAPKILPENKRFWVSRTSPDGTPWKPLSPEYQKAKMSRFGNQPILRISGKMLRTAYSYAWDGIIFAKVSNVGLYHQFGTAKMSARPWIGVPKQSLNKLPGIAWKHILK